MKDDSNVFHISEYKTMSVCWLLVSMYLFLPLLWHSPTLDFPQFEGLNTDNHITVQYGVL